MVLESPKFRIWAYNERTNYGEQSTAEWIELAKKKMMQMMVLEYPKYLELKVKCFPKIRWMPLLKNREKDRGREEWEVGGKKRREFSSVQFLSHARLFATPWTAACKASLSITNSQSLLKRSRSQWSHVTIPASVVPFSSCLQSFPAAGSFPMSQFFASGGQNLGVSDSASVFPMNIQDWFP